ncbi:MAG: ATP-dependent zinc protease [Bdellovibrionales bacterium CG10_big_fil_rev_8_21_14_0_10_45_34]|nr:MAG: ATP-dependent zinc protease [Bdellovibrionales bacterium CG10_big_fil_rev_8_21_14_0_10_45_34]
MRQRSARPEILVSELVCGWREWVYLPTLIGLPIKAKVDTGARTSALHASEIKWIGKGRSREVEFKILPTQHSRKGEKKVRAKVIDVRKIKSSSGHETMRPVIRIPIQIGPVLFESEVTLVNRDLMGFRMLLGRQALRKRFLVNTARSYLMKSL